MKKKTHRESRDGFIHLLIKYCLELKKLKPRQILAFNVIANYGSYQVIVGPEYSIEECRSLNVSPHSRRLEINGSIHHLFVNPKRIAPTPKQEDIKSNLRGSVIMKNIVVHIVDQDGNGSKVKIERDDRDGVYAQQKINLAGDDGDSMIEKYKSTGRLTMEAYKIIQEDILKALKK